MRNVANGSIAAVITWIVLGLFMPNEPGPLGIKILLVFFVLGAGVYGLGFDFISRIDRLMHTDHALPVVSDKIKVFGHEIDRPAFLDHIRGFYDRKLPISAYYRTRKDDTLEAGIRPLQRNSRNERRLLESMVESARYEMHRRGVPIKDRLNNGVWPGIFPEGLLIESTELDDGSTAHVLAVDVRGELSRDEWTKAYQAGVGHYDGAWDEKPIENVATWRGTEYAKPNGGVMPLFELELREIISPADAAHDPLEDGGVMVDIPPELRHG